jgi:hypothetical protein
MFKPPPNSTLHPPAVSTEDEALQMALAPEPGPYIAPGDDARLGDEALARRAKAMACTVPLHHLEVSKGRVRDGAFNAYTVWGLAFVAIDTVTVQMDFDRGAAHEAVIEAVLPYAKRQAADRDDAEHRAVCKWVLDELIGTSSQREFTVEYGDFDDGYTRRSFGFQLLQERQAPDGSVYLRATDAAINVLVGALDTDVESAQAAAEAKLENLVRRGRLSDAHDAARQARYRTVQLGEHIRQDIAATKRNIAMVDWSGTVSPRLDSALSHIEERLQVERRITDNIRTTRDKAEESSKRAQAAALIDLLDDCQNRHMVLQRKLMDAREVFRREQQRQVFAPPATVRLRNVNEELLLPLLSVSLDSAEAHLVWFFERVLGTGPRRLGRLTSMVDALLAPPPQGDDLGDEVRPPDLQMLQVFEAFKQPTRDAAAAVLDGVGAEPVRLSALLAEALKDSPATAHLTSLLVLNAFSPALETHLRAGDEQALLVSWSNGAPLPAALQGVGSGNGMRPANGNGAAPHPNPAAGGFHGDDLLVARLDVAAALHLAQEAA